MSTGALRLGGQCRLSSIHTAVNQIPEILQTVLWNFSLLTLGDGKLWPLRVGLALKANGADGGSAALCILAQGQM